VDPSFCGFVGDLWRWTKDAMGCMTLFFEPIMDPTSLIDLSIALLVLERVGANYLQPYERRLFLNESSSLAVPPQQVANDDKVDPSTIAAAMLGSPTLMVLLFGTLAFSWMAANSSYNNHSTMMLLDEGLRMASQQRSAVLLYIMLVLFCFESILVLSLLVTACHALSFPQYGAAEEHITVLFLLTVAWVISLTASNFLRYNLYQSIGD
jgi:Na+/alanine symporter